MSMTQEEVIKKEIAGLKELLAHKTDKMGAADFKAIRKRLLDMEDILVRMRREAQK
jgi:hypothetical protein